MTYSLLNNYLSIKVNAFGNELCLVYSNEHEIEYIWKANKGLWTQQPPNLFPKVGKLKNNEYQYNGKNYTLPQHGFVRDFVFSCVYENENSLIFE